MSKKDGRGRPKKPAGDKASVWIGCAVTQAQKRDFSARAREAKLTDSDYLRTCAGFPATDGK